jgi:hypothetical protein
VTSTHHATMAHRTLRALRMLRAAALAAGVLAAAPVPAQETIPVLRLAAPEAVSGDTLGFLYGVRELADGRVLVNDAARRRLLLLDRSLATARVVAADTGGSMPYGARPTGIIPYRGDSTLFVDQAARALLLLDGRGDVARVMSPPRLPDVGYLWNPGLGSPGLDATGGLVYRSWLLPTFTAPVVGRPYDPPQLPDSAPLLRGDFGRRVADTLAWVRIPKRGRVVTPLPNGGVVLSATVNPMSVIDDWAVLPDGAVAILRGQDYHLDWIDADGTRRSSPKLPFDWRRLTEADKRAIVDSTRRAIEQMAAAPAATGAAAGLAAAAGGMMNHSMTIMPVGAADAPPARAPTPSAPSLPEVVPAGELPDYVPPVLRAGTMKADRAGNVWILPSTSAQAGAGLLYDVVNGRGVLVRRVRLPAGRALEGFGADGAVYMTSHGAGGTRLERARLPR